jgi:hypothetical protein
MGLCAPSFRSFPIYREVEPLLSWTPPDKSGNYETLYRFCQNNFVDGVNPPIISDGTLRNRIAVVFIFYSSPLDNVSCA